MWIGMQKQGKCAHKICLFIYSFMIHIFSSYDHAVFSYLQWSFSYPGSLLPITVCILATSVTKNYGLPATWYQALRSLWVMRLLKNEYYSPICGCACCYTYTTSSPVAWYWTLRKTFWLLWLLKDNTIQIVYRYTLRCKILYCSAVVSPDTQGGIFTDSNWITE